MKLIILLICTPLVCTELHTLMTTYTGIRGIVGIPGFFAVSTLDGQQMDYYDGITQTLSPRQKWLEEYVFTDMWKADTETRKHVQDMYKTNIDELMSRFKQEEGIHTYQRMYGCCWDSKTNESDGFDEYGYDGEDFISLDLNVTRYKIQNQTALKTVQKWNKRLQEDFLTNYFKYECLFWLKYFLDLANGTNNRTALPKVSLLQKMSDDSVLCHATGFYPKNASIIWRKNGEHLNESLVKLGECLPNDDGTFQITATLYMARKDWKKDQYDCVVEHKSWTEKIQKILTEDEIKSNNRKTSRNHFPVLPVGVVVVVIIVVVGGVLHRQIKSNTSTSSQTYHRNV